MQDTTKTVQGFRTSFECILFDLNTQCDLFLPKGALPVVNRAEVLPNIGRIMNWARVGSVPVVSSLECRRIEASARGLPAYCIDGSAGQRKVPVTLLSRRIVVHDDNTVDVPPDYFRRYQQIILIKRSCDFLANPKADRLFHALSIHHLVVIGAVAEYDLTSTVISLLARDQRVAVVTDACGAWSVDAAAQSMRQMDAKGAVLVTTEELISGAANERLRNAQPIIAPEEQEPVVA